MAAPYGNQNAKGNKGGGAPAGNKNAFLHGGYETIAEKDLTEEEKGICGKISNEPETLIIEEIALLTIRERRILQRMAQLNANNRGLVTSHSERNETLWEFETEEERELFNIIQKQLIDAGKLPGHSYSLKIVQVACDEIMLRLEEALTRCQVQKLNCVRTLISLREDEQTHIGPPVNLMEAVLGSNHNFCDKRSAKDKE